MNSMRHEREIGYTVGRISFQATDKFFPSSSKWVRNLEVLVMDISEIALSVLMFLLMVPSVNYRSSGFSRNNQD